MGQAGNRAARLRRFRCLGFTWPEFSVTGCRGAFVDVSRTVYFFCTFPVDSSLPSAWCGLANAPRARTERGTNESAYTFSQV